MDGKITKAAAAIELGISIRQCHNLVKKYIEYGPNGLIHGLKGRISNRRIKDETKEKIIDIVHEERLSGCKPTFTTKKNSRMLQYRSIKRDNKKNNDKRKSSRK